MNKQPDVTEKTKQRMIDAFWKLAQNCSIDKMTVGAITREASVNRSTFYNYYTDIYDLLDAAEEQLLHSIKEDVLLLLSNSEEKTLREFSSAYTKVFIQYVDKGFFLLSEKGDPCFAKKMQDTMTPLISELFHFPDSIPNRDYLIIFIFSAFQGMIQHWYESGKNLEEEELVAMAQQMIASCILCFDAEWSNLSEMSLSDIFRKAVD